MLGTWKRLSALVGKDRKRAAKTVVKKRFRSLLMEGLERRELFAVLSAGDIAFTGYNGTTSVERVSFVVLRDIPNDSTTVNFTDNGFNANGSYNSNEGLTTVVFTAAVTAGSRFYLEGLALKNFDGSAAAATVTGTASALSNTGDQVSAFQGTLAAPTSNIASISSFSYLTTGSINNSTSYLPTGLTLGTHAVALGTGNFNGVLNSADPDIGTTVSGSKATILSKVNDITNWTASTSTTLTVPPAIAFNVTSNSPTLSIAATDASKAEGNSGTTSFTFTVTRSIDTTGTNTVDYAVTGGATNPADAADFGGSFPTGTITFAPTEISKVITISVTGDTTVEPDNSFVVTLSNPSSPAVISTGSANGSIVNDDSSFSIATLSATKPEGNSGTTAFTFTITRTGATTAAATVDYSTLGSGANPTDAADFSGATSGTVNFAAGDTSKVVTINVVGDTVAEADETFDVTLANAVGTPAISATVGTPASATGTIQNDDAATQIAIAATDASKKEGTTGGTTAFTFTVSRTGVTTGTSSATWTVTGSGTNPADTATDFTAPLTGTVSFADGETSQVITILVNADSTIEPDEGFTVTLSAPSSGTAITTTSADGLIQNDDLSVSLPTTAISTVEGNSGLTPVSVTVTRTGDTSVSTTVDWAITGTGTNAASASDFGGGVFPSGTITFAAGDTTATISFNIQGDTTVELDETYTLTLSNASGGAVIGTATQAGTIVTDDVVTLSAGDIAFTGYNGTTTPERVSFVVLRDIPNLTNIKFTDSGFTTSNGQFNTNEGLTQVVFTSDIPAGSRFYLEGLALKNFDGSAAAATVTGSASALSNSGDQVTAYQGPANAPTAILASISSGAYITTGAINNSTSYLPTGLTLGTTAISLGDLTFNGVLNSADPDIGTDVAGSQSNILGRVNDIANWVASTSTTLVVPPAITFTVTNPVTPTITATPLTKVYDGTSYAITATADDGPGGAAADTTQGNFTFTYYAGPNLTGGTIAAPTNVGSYSVDVAYAGNASYNAVPTTSFNFTITAAPLTITANSTSKTYGETVTFTGTEFSTGSGQLFGGDTVGSVSLTSAGAAATAGVAGSPYSIVPSAAIGTGLGNYNISYVNGSLTVNAKAATITADAKSKLVGEADPALTFSVSGTVNGDTATGALSRDPGEAVGTYPINQNTVSLGANYAVTYIGASLTISSGVQVTPTITSTPGTKVYDGTAFVIAVNASASGSPTDSQTGISTSGTFGNFVVQFYAGATTSTSTVATAPKNAGTYAYTVAYAGNANFTAVAAQTFTYTVTPKALTANAAVTSRAYDGTTAATITFTSLTGFVGTETVTASGTGTFASKDFGTSAVTANAPVLSNGANGGLGSNYSLATPTGLSGNITKKALTATAVANNKVYDKNNSATITYSNITGLIGTETVVVTGTGTFAQATVGPWAVTAAAPSLANGTNGGLAINYSLTTPTGLSASITKKSLTIGGVTVDTKVYDRTTAATVSGTPTLVGVLAGDSVGLFSGGETYTFDNKNVGTNKVVTSSGFGLTGSPSVTNNYSLDPVLTATGTITAKALTATSSAASRVYNATTNASVTIGLVGVIGGDTVTASATGTFNNKNVGPSKPVTVGTITLGGADGGNYTVGAAPATTASITTFALTATGTGVNKVYDATTAASVNINLVGVFSGDTVTGSATGTFINKNVGPAKTVTIGTVSLSGTDAANYTVGSAGTTTANISAFTLSATGTGVNKVYNATTAAAVNVNLTGVFSGDTVTGTATGTFSDKNVGNAKTVTIGTVTLAGTDSGNYLVGSAGTTTADITPFTLSATATGVNKVYDATTAGSVTIALTGVFSGDTVSGSASGTFSDKNVGPGKSVTVGSITLAGTDSGNYLVTPASSTTANITAAALTGSITAANKVFDGNTSATILTRTLAGVFSGDTVSYVGGTATFSDAAVGNGKTVTATGLSLSGADAGNYTVNATASTTANILALTPAVSGPIGINGGQAQRSQLTSLTVTFNTAVTLDPGAITVGNVGLLTSSTLTNLATSQVIISPSSGASTTFTITFDTLTAVAAGQVSGGVVKRANGQNSLADGTYQLNIDATKVKNVNNVAMPANYSFGTSQADNFFRMYGDSNGDGVVSGSDLTAFRLALASYNAAFDWDGNGSVSSSGVDYTNFTTNYGKRRRTL